MLTCIDVFNVEHISNTLLLFSIRIIILISCNGGIYRARTISYDDKLDCLSQATVNIWKQSLPSLVH